MKIFLKILAVIWMILWGICVLASFLSKETSYAPIFIVLMLMGLIPFFVGKNNRKVNNTGINITTKEKLLSIDGYLSGKTITINESHVKISRKASIFAQTRDKSIPISSISGVEVKKPGALVNGYIQIQIPGQISSSSSFSISGGAYDAVRDENAVVFTGQDNYQTALKMKEYIENYSSQSKSISNNYQQSTADELLKFKHLLDSGVITQNEFETKKKQLLNGI